MPAHKQLFQEDKERRKAHTALVNSDAFELGVTFALADYAADCPTKEQLEGVRRFLDRFIRLADKEEEAPNPFGAPRLIPPEQLGKEPEE